jgi:starvation-inducible DNA-binding protein
LSLAQLDSSGAPSRESCRQSHSERDYVQSLSGELASFGKIARNAISKSNELSDAVSADIFTEISRGVDKWLWMVEAHLHLQR